MKTSFHNVSFSSLVNWPSTGAVGVSRLIRSLARTRTRALGGKKKYLIHPRHEKSTCSSIITVIFTNFNMKMCNGKIQQTSSSKERTRTRTHAQRSLAITELFSAGGKKGLILAVLAKLSMASQKNNFTKTRLYRGSLDYLTRPSLRRRPSVFS